MPELPEVETICRGLAQHCVGAVVLSAHIHRPGFVRGSQNQIDLFTGLTIACVSRHGKQFVLESLCGRAMLFHMGMSGSVTVRPFLWTPATHVHVRWTLTRDGKKFEIHHKDPRRFGFVHTYDHMKFVRDEIWSKLGPDALVVTAQKLFERLKNRPRAIKAALLDQSIIAGVGNIYADESLFQSGIHPLRKAQSITLGELVLLVKKLRSILKKSIHGGGSTIQDHASAMGIPGSFQNSHLVYGRGKLPCTVCGTNLRQIMCVQRTTVFCPTCQPRRPKKHI